jgi:hypothetical protein
MDLGPLRALALDLNFSAHGVDATVTRPAPDDVPIETRVIWMTTVATDQAEGGDYIRRDPHRVMVLRRDEVPTAPRGTVIVAPEKSGDTPVSWVIDAHDKTEADQHRVVVLRQPAHC